MFTDEYTTALYYMAQLLAHNMGCAAPRVLMTCAWENGLTCTVTPRDTTPAGIANLVGGQLQSLRERKLWPAWMPGKN